MIDFDGMDESAALELIVAIERHFNFNIPFVWTPEDLDEICFAQYDRHLNPFELQACFDSGLWRKGLASVGAEDQRDVLYEIIDEAVIAAAKTMEEEYAASRYEDLRDDRD
jgi:hypothetical protein